jgi:hypothetical protein
MPVLSVDNAKTALTTVLNMWLNQNPAAFQVSVGGQLVNIIFADCIRNKRRLDFGFPNLYTFPKAQLNVLKTWWTAQKIGCAMLPPQIETGAGHEKVNFMVYPAKSAGVTVNFHIALS